MIRKLGSKSKNHPTNSKNYPREQISQHTSSSIRVRKFSSFYGPSIFYFLFEFKEVLSWNRLMSKLLFAAKHKVSNLVYLVRFLGSVIVVWIVSFFFKILWLKHVHVYVLLFFLFGN